MPTSLRVGPYRFFFYAGDHDEPAHTHVQRDDAEAKFWLRPVRMAFSRVFSAFELRGLEQLTRDYEIKLLENWNEYFGIGH